MTNREWFDQVTRTVPCPWCLVPAGTQCRWPAGETREIPHATRQERAPFSVPDGRV